jgi:dihydroflavonol-4-reductase
MKVLLTGATGFLGSEIARELVRQGHELRVLVRPTSKLDGLAGLTYDKVEGDVLDAASVERALDGVDALIHTAGNTSARPRDAAQIHRVNVEGTRTVMAAAARRPGLRVVHTSSTSAVGLTRRPRVLDENAVWDVGGLGYHYVDSKRAGETVVLEFFQKGLDVVILNPGMILGPGDVYITSTRYVLEYLRGRNRFAPRGGLAFCDVREVARAHVTALTKGRAGERYILAGQDVTHKEALDTLRRVTGLYRPLHVPAFLFWLAGALSELAARVRPHGLEELNRAVARFAHLYAAYDVAKARRELDYVVRPFDETVRDTVRDFVTRGLHPARTPALADLARPAVAAGAGAV